MAGTGNGNKHTPSMKQYFAAKAQHPDAVLFFRMGDFYEMFHEDAVVVSRELDLTLTSRNKNAADEVPMAGVPYHAAHQYIGKLLTKGYKVAVCEQMADPAKTRGLVPREVVRVLTPSLVTDGDQLDARQNAFLATIEPDDDGFGLALFDFSTGELRATRLGAGGELLGELARAAPREVLVGPLASEVRDAIKALLHATALRDDGGMTPTQARAVLTQSFGSQPDLEKRVLAFEGAALVAAARAVRFAAVCSPGATLPVRRVETWNPRETLQLDEVAQRHLELVESSDGSKAGALLTLLDATGTPGGARLLRRRLLAPLLSVEAIKGRLDAVELFVHNPAQRAELRGALGQIADLERLAVRASLQEATPKDLGSLRDSLALIPAVVGALGSLPEPAPEVLGLTAEPVDLMTELQQLLARALVDRPPALAREGGIFRTGYSAELDEQVGLQSGGTQNLSELEGRLRAETGAATLKVKYTRVFGWYIEVTDRHASKVPAGWRRKQTVAGAERYTNDELDQLSDRVLHAEDRARDLETQLYKQLLQTVGAAAVRLNRLAARLADWDVSAALADVAHRHDYCRPEVDTTYGLELIESRHPVVERLAAAGQFVPNDVRLDVEGERLWLITGPNMSGKSTLMRQVALTVLMAQMGSFVPARSARIGVVDRVLSRVGASDNLSRGESTFMVEMRETATILSSATRRSLVILDEIGRGTSTYDGLSIAWAVAEHLHEIVQCRALFATHYHEITELTKLAKNAANYSVAAREFGDDIVFLHKISPGAASRSYGIAVARLAGLPEGVLARAKGILDGLEASGALPVGSPASLRRRDKQGKTQLDPQLDLFVPPPVETRHAALDTLRSLDPERLSPLEALQLLIKLKGLVKLVETSPPTPLHGRGEGSAATAPKRSSHSGSPLSSPSPRPWRGGWGVRLLFLLSGGCSIFHGEVDRQVHGRLVPGPYVSDDAYAAFLIGATAEQSHDLVLAERAFRQASDLDPKAVEPRVRLGAVRCARATPDHGGDDFAQAAKLDADFAPLWRERGACALHRQELSAARTDLTRALALDPAEPATPLLLAETSLAQHDAPAAARWIESLLARGPLSPDALAFVRTHATEPALAPIARRLEKADPPPAPVTTGEPLAALDQALRGCSLDEARVLGRRAQLSPGELAARLVALGRPTLAVEQARLVLAADPESADARVALLVASQSLDDTRRALTGTPLSTSRPGPLAGLLLADLVARRSGPDAGRAALRLVAPAPRNDALTGALRRRLEATP